MNKMNQLFEGFRRWGTLTEEQLLAEGRLEDAKKKYPDLHPDAIDALSTRDPSGKNKYLMGRASNLIRKYLNILQGPTVTEMRSITTSFTPLFAILRAQSRHSTKILRD